MDVSAAGVDLPCSWDQLPSDVVQLLGSMFSDPQHLRHATMVCKQWRSNLAAGVEELHMDMPPDTDAWLSRVQRLGSLLPKLGRCKAHISSAVPVAALASNLKVLGEELAHIEHLHLDLSEGAELWLSTGAELGALRRLRRLTLTGGTFSGASAQALLRGLCQACPQLEELRLLPAPRCGLGDADMELLVELKHLKVLSFQAYRLTSAGLMQLMDLQQLQALSVMGLDAWGVDTAAFVARPTLESLHLGCDYELPPGAVEALQGVPDLSMTFRWTDKVRGLLKTCSLHLSRQLVKLDLGCVRLGSGAAALEGLAALQGLTDLRLSVYSNSDTRVTLDLGQLAPLSKLKVLQLAKQRAYFPEQRRLLESNITVPVTAEAVRGLAGSCPELQTLRLTLGRGDLQQEGLEQLTAFANLRTLFISAEPFSSPPCPLPLDLTRLPKGLQQLELRNIDLLLPTSSSSRSSSSNGGGSTSTHVPSLGLGWGSSSQSSSLGSSAGGGSMGGSSQRNSSSGGSLSTSMGSSTLGLCWTVSSSRLLSDAHNDTAQLSDTAGDSSRSSSSGGGGAAPSELRSPWAGSRPGWPQPDPSSSGADLAHLRTLTRLQLEGCRLSRHQLQDLVAAVPDLQQLKLAHVAGLCNSGVSALSRLTGLQQLTLVAPRNKAVTQASLHTLAGLRELRHLTWESDDLSNAGPVLGAYAHFTLLRSLALNCSKRMVAAVCGSDDVFNKLMPYCDVNMVQG